MAKYVVKRLLASIVTLFFVMLITFVLMESLPGMPTMDRRMQEKLGLNDPLIIKFFRYFFDILTGDFGESMSMSVGASVSRVLFQQGRIMLTLKICGASLLIAVVLGVPMGCIAAQYKDRLPDNIIRVLSTLGMSVPLFVLAVYCMFLFGVYLKILPIRSLKLTEPQEWIMPLLCMSTSNMFSTARRVRISVLDVMGSDYVRTAKAKGLSDRQVLYRHTLRTGLIPVITHVGAMVPDMILNIFVVESTFVIPGFGTYLTTCISQRDYPVIMATTYLFAIMIIAVYFVVDICYAMADPRIHYGEKVE